MNVMSEGNAVVTRQVWATVEVSDALRRMGFASAVSVVLFSVSFSVSGILGFAGVLTFPWDPILPDVASLFLAVSFVVMMVSLHHSVEQNRRPWSELGVLFAAMYAVLVSMVYFVIATVVVPYIDRGQVERVALLEFDETGSFMQAVDGLGYFFMSLATFSAAFAFSRTGRERWLRRVFLLNGVLGVPILVSYMPLVIAWSEYLIPLNALWIVTVPACGVLVALRFRRTTVT